ncbi:uncharacterized protein LOC122934940 [Bufo gargarizans]|uniref:uncharacterized protein LOC122934940 n=1 Tax=Bufo gargarizans TaxID=30331 RepID=UPI001CF5E5EA|nr:uncharacterized protein LOC122934940 [Bufo gargarizans]
MGSGSSKSKRRVISFCSQQPLHPTEIPKGERIARGMVACEQNKGDDGTMAKATQSVLETKNSRSPPIDPDLQLLDDILTESEDCSSWQEPMGKGPKMTNSTQENQRWDKEVPRTLKTMAKLQPVSSEDDGTLHIQQTMGGGSSKTAPGTTGIFDLENNNLPKPSHTCPDPTEADNPIAYDDTEEALMESIEEEYSQLHPVPSMHCQKM